MRLRHLAPCAALLLLAACNRQPPDIETLPESPADAQAQGEAGAGATGAPLPETPSADDLQPVAVSADAVAVGSAAAADGRAIAAKAEYTLADTIHASAATAGKAGASAHVYWTYEDGNAIKEEEKPVNGDVVAFSLSAADGMKPGKYNVQIDLDGVPVGITDFVVK
ncbi:MAG TPA: hypothetical protein VFK18_03430 [Luteimonas sp.]|nr:hypothetical protein [Luteimonas sp.]